MANVIFILIVMSISLFLLFWGYAGHFYFLRFVTRNTSKPWYWNEEIISNCLSDVSVIIPTFNEEKVIENKIKNLLELEYPQDKIEFLVIDSNSTDKTQDIVNKIPEIKLIVQNEAKGKLSAINYAMKFAKNDILIINDANTIIEKNALLHLCKPFVDQSIGCVGAKYDTIGSSAIKLVSHEQGYRDREHKLWELETLFDSCFVCGELFAFRRHLIQKLNEKTLGDDLDVSIQVRSNGYKVVFQPLAVVYEKVQQNLNDFRLQKIRRTIVTIRVLKYLKSANRKYKLIYFSHKFIPIISPFLIILLIFSLFHINFYFGLSILGISMFMFLISKEVRYIMYMMYITIIAWIKNFTLGNKWLRGESSR